MVSIVRSLIVLSIASAAAAAQPAPTIEQRSPESAPGALVKQYCLGCHNSKVKTAGLTLDTVSVDRVAEHPDVWEKVLRKVRARYMPPVGLPRPSGPAYDAFVSYLEISLDQAAANPNPGRTDTFRRLNRTEYQNAIRDLLALDINVSSLLPSDDSSHGFDNITVGALSPTLLERYLGAARKVSRLAIGTVAPPLAGDVIVLPLDLTQDEHFDELPLGTRGGTNIRYTFPADAVYELQLRLTRDHFEHVEGLNARHQLEVSLDGERLQVFDVGPSSSGRDYDLVDNGLHLRTPVKAGPHTLGVAFLKQPSVLLETEREPNAAHFSKERHPRIEPALYSVTITGPYDPKGSAETPSRSRIFVCRPLQQSEEEPCAARILSGLARRAYRQPINADDLHALLNFYKEGRAHGGFEAGIEEALRALLVSPRFLFQIERDSANIAPNTAYRLTDLELASRLALFLWSSIPDDELLDLAIQGKLKNPTVLDRQVRRMLADTRSEALVNSFADQWLYLRNLTSTVPDGRLFLEFDDNLRQAFRRETELFFESIMREDRNVLDFLGANYTFVNERLAKHYGIPNIFGSQFRRVTFNQDSARGGLLGQGSILTVTSYANRTSPVLRGKWVLANILDAPPPPPPMNVPPLKDHGNSGNVQTMRERMAEHRANPACAGCHKLMDPIGFSLENYDAIGRWRSRDGAAPIDASGSLPDGSSFAGASGLRQALLNRPELFVTALSEKLLIYGLGRGLEFYDGPAVRKIVRDSSTQDYRFSSLILGVVNSVPFQMRRSQ